MNEKKWILYKTAAPGTQCNVIFKELIFLFNLPEEITATDDINMFISSTGFYITET